MVKHFSADQMQTTSRHAYRPGSLEAAPFFRRNRGRNDIACNETDEIYNFVDGKGTYQVFQALAKNGVSFMNLSARVVDLVGIGPNGLAIDLNVRTGRRTGDR
jgi:hypothetical protein